MKPPKKPFDSYKWRWLSFEPTEGLLSPPVFLGVIRALGKHEGMAPSDQAILDELKTVQKETRTRVVLGRARDRNLIRNSGQYWKETGLLADTRGMIQLTPLGRSVAIGSVTQSEFAATIIQQTVLPNPRTYSQSEMEKWERAELKIQPFALILNVMEILGRSAPAEAYLTPRELIDVVIPLAGAKESQANIARCVQRKRMGNLSLVGWPNCVPKANDRRIARQFLLFLANFGICSRIGAKKNVDEQFLLQEVYDFSALSKPVGPSIFDDPEEGDAIIEAVRKSELPTLIDRQKSLVNVIKRPSQTKFRGDVLAAYGGKCFLTHENVSEVLEAAHIIPVKHGGDDVIGNGICLRVDVHRLFDSGHIRLLPTGDLKFSQALAGSPNYSKFPDSVRIPRTVQRANLSWRHHYL